MMNDKLLFTDSSFTFFPTLNTIKDTGRAPNVGLTEVLATHVLINASIAPLYALLQPQERKGARKHCEI
jgi:hypothetical protein